MKTEHPITPPPDLVQQWCHEDGDEIKTSPRWFRSVCTKAARWGADQELKACCEWLLDHGYDLCSPVIKDRRPKPPSLKEQALEALDRMDQLPTAEDQHIIRRALEALPDV